MLLAAFVPLAFTMEDEGADPQPLRWDPAAVARSLPLPDLAHIEDSIAVDGFNLLPMGNLGRAWEFHPKALAGVVWDSNPLLAHDDSPNDMQLRLGVGFESRVNGRDGWRSDQSVMIRTQRYADTEGRNWTGGDAALRVLHEGPGGTQLLSAAWDRGSDPLPELPEQVLRDIVNTGLSLGSESLNSFWWMRVGWNTLNYREDTSTFNSNDRDFRRWSAQAAWHLRGADDSLLGIESMAESVTHSSESEANDYVALTTDGRWWHAIGRRSYMDLQAGFTVRRHDGYSDGDPDNDDRTMVAPSLALTSEWGWEEGSHLKLAVSSRLAEGITATTNASRQDSLEAELRLRLLERLDFVQNGWVTMRTDSAPSGPAGNQAIEATYDSFLRAGLDYRLRDGLGVRLWASWLRHRARVAQGYERSLAALEFVAAL